MNSKGPKAYLASPMFDDEICGSLRLSRNFSKSKRRTWVRDLVS
jgi:hypothetical protein